MSKNTVRRVWRITNRKTGDYVESTKFLPIKREIIIITGAKLNDGNVQLAVKQAEEGNTVFIGDCEVTSKIIDVEV